MFMIENDDDVERHGNSSEPWYFDPPPERDPHDEDVQDAYLTFEKALSDGDTSATARALRTMISLGCGLAGAALETLAERFEGRPDPDFPKDLLFGRREKGRPRRRIFYDAGHQRSRRSMASDVVAELRKPNMNVKAAIATVSKRTGWSEGTVKAAYYRYRHSL
jgi:hypothetical protein